MSLWVDKHRPKKLSKMDYHAELSDHLTRLVSSGDFPHLLIHGPSGAGKKTRVMALLRELYGHGVDRLRIEHQGFETPSKKKIEILTIASNYHIEVNASDVGIYDRIVIQELIKTMASSQQLNSEGDPRNHPEKQNNPPMGIALKIGLELPVNASDVGIYDRIVIQELIKTMASSQQLNSEGQRDFKVVVLTEVDRLTKDAQHALRRTMEKYMATCRILLVTNSTSKVIPAIRSRCLNIRIPAPSVNEVMRVLQTVAKKEGCNLPSELAQKISEKSQRNLRRAILLTEACKVQQYPFKNDQDVMDLDWEVFLKDTAQQIVQEQSPKRLQEVRGRLYELLTHCIPPDVIFIGLHKELVKNCDGELRTEVTHLASQYEHRLTQGNKSIYHLEAFVAKFMSIYMKFVEETMGDF
ncbi:hypothetical protein TCAL_08145 [Tigriopus californicus]|uniref:Replication factor C subunit 3 n=1 Tax=Tigriopus californicus TaxID=6832 RepID=A0A553P414_TIGCA|nr:hypothetical protein TCAL_08145 [Tigriopus californicus]